jgi:hypothetical protein
MKTHHRLETVEAYLAAVLKLACHEVASDRFTKPNRWRVIPEEAAASLPFACEDLNALRSAVEVYEWEHNPPEKYVLYCEERPAPQVSYRFRTGEAQTWTGQALGACFFGEVYRSCFGDRRQSVTVRATNGFLYVGTFYCGAGNYARVRQARRKGKPVAWREGGTQ